jgi:ATP-dependent DNA helicase PIF1
MEWIVIIIVGFVIYSFFKDHNTRKKVTYIDSDGTHKTEKLAKRESRKLLAIEKPQNFEITPQIEAILNKLENTSNNFFLTGKAGTGKSTLLKYFRATTKKNHAVVAPTGIAALNVQGQTIHSFFGWGTDVTLSRIRYVRPDKQIILRKLDTLIIDEISMVRADLLDCIDKSLKVNRRNNLPFGGVQIIAVGDPYQLPPVVKSDELKYIKQVYGGPYFFNAKSYREARFEKLELTKIYRQKDDIDFKNILNSIRIGELTSDQINVLNTRANTLPNQNAIKLVTTNALAQMINNAEMRKLPGEEKKYTAQIIDDFNDKNVPTAIELILKEGARVMLLNNDKKGRWVNGDVGYVIGLGENSVKLKFDDNTYDDIELNEWDNVKFIYDEESGKIEPVVVGIFIQLPIKLAWAVTIHKSQGKTYDNVHIDFGTGTFAPGQAYVALSRCTSLQGLSFEAPIVIEDVLIDEDVKIFMGDSMTTQHVVTTPRTIVTQVNKPPSLNNKVSISDINKMYFFIKNSERYAINTEKAKAKVSCVKNTFEKIKDTLDDKTMNDYNEAMIKYERKLTR